MTDTQTNAKAGFTYLVELIKNGVVIESETVHNIMPEEGINHMLGVTMKGASQAPNWFIGLYENAYNPGPGDKAATFPGDAGESTAYDEATRVAFVSGAPTAGVLSNTANRAEFTFNASKLIAGGFIASTSAKGSTAGVLMSAVRFSSPKAVEAGTILRVTAGLTIVSA